MPKPYSIDLREKVINAYHHGKEPVKRKQNTISGVAKRFEVSIKFVKNLLKLYRETGSVIPKPHGGGYPPKISTDGFKFLLETVKKQSDLTIDELTIIYNHSFIERVSSSTIGRALLKLKLTRKKKTFSDPRKYVVSNQLKTKLYRLALRQLEPKQLIFLDETGMTINMVREHARSSLGQRAYATKSLNRGTRVSTIGALSYHGLMAELCFEGTLNSHLFNYFIETLLVPKLQPGNVIILDNASAHSPDDLREILTPIGVQVLFLPTYSPELNPIELVWSQMKSFMKKHTAKTQESLYQTISQAILSITPSNAFHYFQHCLQKMGIDLGVHSSG